MTLIMPTKSTQPALYEKMRDRSAATPAATTQRTDSPAPTSELNQWVVLLSPGRTIRLPVGYILLAAGLTIVLVTVAYIIGHSSGSRVARKEYEQRLQNNPAFSSDADLRTDDPLAALVPENGTATSSKTSSATPPNRGSNAAPSTWGPVVPKTDPRKKGLSYFILAQTNDQGAVRLSEFCRSYGLETYVVSGKNDRLRRVVAFPGFDLSVTKITGPEIAAFKDRIYQIGEKWKSQKRGESNLSDAFPEKYGD